MKRKIIFSAFLTFVLAAVSYGQTPGSGSPNRLMFSLMPDSSGTEVVTVTYTGLENPDVRVFESLVPASSTAECHSSTDFPNPRVLGSEEATVVFDSTTSTYRLRFFTHTGRENSCRVLRVGGSVSAADLTAWQSNYGAGGFASYPTEDARPTRPVGGEITYTFTVTNTSLWGAVPTGKE